jgi:hypothetical protein
MIGCSMQAELRLQAIDFAENSEGVRTKQQAQRGMLCHSQRHAEGYEVYPKRYGNGKTPQAFAIRAAARINVLSRFPAKT